MNDHIQIPRTLLASHIAEIDSWNASMEKILGEQLGYRWESLEALRSALQQAEPEEVDYSFHSHEFAKAHPEPASRDNRIRPGFLAEEVLDRAKEAGKQQMTEAYTAVDMATAAASGFRDGQAAVQLAPAQDEREAFKRALHDQKVFKLNSSTIDAAEWAWFARPPQTEQQPEQIGPPTKQYYYRTQKCEAPSSVSESCTCWHDAGTGPFPNTSPGEAVHGVTLSWRDKPIAQPEQSKATIDVLAERRRQVEREGWAPAHDDLYDAAELPRAAAAYVLNGANEMPPCIWPFGSKWWKPRDGRANYVRAAALLLAEIERIDRATLSAQGGER